MATKIVEPKEKFLALSEVDIERALNDPDLANPIAVEVARLVQGYTANFQAYVQRAGHVPADIMHIAPRSPIEAVCMRLTHEAIKDALRG